MRIVYRALDTKLDGTSLLKVLPPELLSDWMANLDRALVEEAERKLL
ncbi:MAG: hypothetical protein ACRD21_06150 [Vicinamibacteria bacterium]